jgi:hypothetical protein
MGSRRRRKGHIRVWNRQGRLTAAYSFLSTLKRAAPAALSALSRSLKARSSKPGWLSRWLREPATPCSKPDRDVPLAVGFRVQREGEAGRREGRVHVAGLRSVAADDTHGVSRLFRVRTEMTAGRVLPLKAAKGLLMIARTFAHPVPIIRCVLFPSSCPCQHGLNFQVDRMGTFLIRYSSLHGQF